ncbi:MAG: tetratricopeptide repeat protein [Methylovirgula sp.]
MEQAEILYKQILQFQPQNVNVVFLLGLSYAQRNKYGQAAEFFGKAARLKPDFVDAHYNCGLALHFLDRLQEALESYDRVIGLKPDHAIAIHNRGNIQNLLGFDKEALASYETAIRINPNYADAYYNRGIVLHALERYSEAVQSYDKALKLNPSDFKALYSRGAALGELKRNEEALQSHDRALQLKPDCAEAHSNRGATLGELKRYEEALQSYDRALQLTPGYAEAHRNRGATLGALKRYEEALRSYDRAFQLKPDMDFLRSQILDAKIKICDWSNYSGSVDEIRDRILHDQKVAVPFVTLAMPSSLNLQKKVSEIWVKAKNPATAELAKISKRPLRQTMRIGYFSADFHNHPVAFSMAELFERHDRSKFEIIAFSFGPDTGDDMRKRLELAFDKFIDAQNMSDRDIALLARKLEIDIAIDLNGFTQGARTNIFAMRAAPIQVNYLGYPATMGADYIDYLIADPTLIPASYQQYYSEKIVYLPNSFFPNDHKRQISDKVFMRSEVGLPQEGFVFCCFNSNYKITPDVFESWMRILTQAEGSVLWLLKDNERAATNLKREASVRGVNPDRLVFAPRMVALADHLARHRLADLFLDTLPYNAHTTASDALWVGLPVLTQIGETFAGRVAASLLNAIDIPELITTTRDDYEALALELAANPTKLAGIKRKLSDNRLTTPLFDSQLFRKHIETAYIAMYERYQADLPPDHLYVPK